MISRIPKVDDTVIVNMIHRGDCQAIVLETCDADDPQLTLYVKILLPGQQPQERVNYSSDPNDIGTWRWPA